MADREDDLSALAESGNILGHHPMRDDDENIRPEFVSLVADCWHACDVAHAQGKAVDVRGPYGCIYEPLKGWTGGYSIDAGRMQHIHISYDDAGGREMGLRFAHGGRHSWRDSYARMR